MIQFGKSFMGMMSRRNQQAVNPKRVRNLGIVDGIPNQDRTVWRDMELIDQFSSGAQLAFGQSIRQTFGGIEPVVQSEALYHALERTMFGTR